MHQPGEELCNCEFSLAYGECTSRLPSSHHECCGAVLTMDT